MLREINNTGDPLKAPDGSVLANIYVRFTLSNKHGDPVDGRQISTNDYVAGFREAKTDVNGEFSLSVITNDDITGDTWYEVAVRGLGYQPFVAKVMSGAGAESFSNLYTGSWSPTNTPQLRLTDLSDTPGTMAGQGGKALRVAPGENSFEFYTPAAGGGGTDVIPETAGETLGGHVVVALVNGKVYKYNPANPTHYGTAHGVTTQSGTINATINVQVRGKLSNVGGWSFISGPLFASATGQVANTAPLTGIAQNVGYAVDANTMYVDIKTAIQLV